jgi:hypothetical protein
VKKYLVAAVAVALIGMSLAACSTGPTGTPSAALTNAAVAPVNNRSYTANDIASILRSVNTSLNLGGTVETPNVPQLQPIDALGSYLNGGSPTVTPAHCNEMLQSDGQVLGLLNKEGVVSEDVLASILSSSQLNIIATAVHGAPIPASRVASFAANQRALVNSCKHLTIVETVNGQPTSISVDYKLLSVNTTANQTVGFAENWAITGGGAGSTSSSTTLEAVDGNLLIFVSSVNAQDAGGLENAVNAVVAAAK